MSIHRHVGALAQADRLDLGPGHPTRAGVVDLSFETVVGGEGEPDDVERVTACEIAIGQLHRGAEKLFEVRDYRQVLMLADRHDWQAPFSGELGAALACEQLWGLPPPPRATLMRTLLAEMARIQSHLGHLSFVTFTHDRRCGTSSAIAMRSARERARELMLALSGNRLHPMLNRLGGLSVDPSQQWLASLEPWLRDVEAVAAECERVLLSASFDHARGLGTITAAEVSAYGLSGPVARASGVAIDLRRNPGYLFYPQLSYDRPPPEGLCGDAVSRLRWLAHEVAESASLVRQCVRASSDVGGPITVKLAKIIKLPDAEVRVATEAPWGVASYHLVSRGDRTPWRLALRTPTFAQVQALQVALVGTPLDQVDVVVASMAWTTGDLDK